ncbi:MAG: trypsin-like peptidase domain-containing protein [Candidatus Bathyarchaeia archaeon]
MKLFRNQKAALSSLILLVIVAISSLVAGGILGYIFGYSHVSRKVNDLENQLSTLQSTQNPASQNIVYQNVTQNITYQNITYVMGENISLSQLYEQIKDSVVMVKGITLQYNAWGIPYYSQVQGSGFVYNFTGRMVIITNYHVVHEAFNITVTFINGNAYEATVLGSDPYSDLAVLSAQAPENEYKQLEIVSSSTLHVGDPVIAVGNPYGLAGSMTTGIVSALGRTITEDLTGGYPIANVIQTTTPLNPGNSGGPLLNYLGKVVGITTAIVSDSQGLGFAIPSNTILREIESLVTKGKYDQHPWLGAAGIDMNYEIAKAMGVTVTYGWLITQVTSGGPADNAGLRGGTQRVLIVGEWVTIGGDIIIAINGTRIRNIDDLASYLEEYTSPGEAINVTIIRSNEAMNLTVTLGKR